MADGIEEDKERLDDGIDGADEAPVSSGVPSTAPAPQVPRTRATPVPREAILAAGPRRGGLIAAALYALATLSLGYPAVMGKFLAGPNSDQYVAGYAFRE